MPNSETGRRAVMVGAAALAAAPVTKFGARAQGTGTRAAWPDRSPRIIVPFAPGGGNDILARLYGGHLSARLGQTFVAESRPGASGAVGTEMAIRSRPDGYTLVVHPSGPVLSNPGQEAPAYDLAKDLVPIGILATFPAYIMVAPNSPHRTLADLIAWGRANPGRGNYGTGGLTFQIFMAWLGERTGAKFETVMYRGSVDSINAAAAGDTTMAVADPGPSIPAVDGRRVRGLVVTSPARMPGTPDVPTIAEAGLPDLQYLAWIGLFAPAGTPPEIVSRLEAEVREVSRMPDVAERLRPLGMSPDFTGGEEFRRLIETEAARWKDIARAAGLSLSR